MEVELFWRREDQGIETDGAPLYASVMIAGFRQCRDLLRVGNNYVFQIRRPL